MLIHRILNFVHLVCTGQEFDLHIVAGSVPGSYLGMDPAFLVWIPPLEEGDILKEMNETDGEAPIYEVNYILKTQNSKPVAKDSAAEDAVKNEPDKKLIKYF